jgi:hypothetical protein
MTSSTASAEIRAFIGAVDAETIAAKAELGNVA